jgi:hypothetical protein
MFNRSLYFCPLFPLGLDFCPENRRSAKFPFFIRASQIRYSVSNPAEGTRRGISRVTGDPLANGFVRDLPQFKIIVKGNISFVNRRLLYRCNGAAPRSPAHIKNDGDEEGYSEYVKVFYSSNLQYAVP